MLEVTCGAVEELVEQKEGGRIARSPERNVGMVRDKERVDGFEPTSNASC